MPELRISDLSPGPNDRRITVAWQDGPIPRETVVEFTDVPDTGDGERIRWYLEDYAEYPADPAPAIAQAAEERLARTGVELFNRLFSGTSAAGIWERATDQLGKVRIEVDTDPGAGPGLPWELLRDPARDAPLALDAAEFVRTHRQTAGRPALPEPAGDQLRVLLVICRPGGRDDVPFRSVAGRLVRGGVGQMEGLDLDVLRPATFARLAEVLHAAHDAGRPYHVVHFDGHGTWLDVADLSRVSTSPHTYRFSLAAPARSGQHGYLVFEDPKSEENQQLADGPTLGKLLAQTGVPVLVLNACRSAYTEAREKPGEASGDVHARIRAYGSLAAEVADAGVPGVVAMRYNVYVVTAAQFVADLYAHLLAGRSLGQAATAARRALAADPVRQIGSAPVELQDWAVPVVYESAPLVLLRPPERAAPVIRLEASGDTEAATGVPRPPDAGFFGRDETLLALDRAFDDQPVVLLYAFAGAGKSSTAAEFARWYQATGGLDDPNFPGTVLWSSFEHHLTADRAIGMAGDHFAELLEANRIPWAALTDPAQRRDIVLQVLAQLPVLWIWDNVEPVAGFPAGTPSMWTSAEQHELVDLLRDLIQHTQCKVLLTSRRDERAWLGGLPAQIGLPAMPMRESGQLAAALAARHGGSLAGADWRPLLRYAAGNPLTITVVVGQALRENLATGPDIAAFVARLRAGEAAVEAAEDAALGRTRSLAASLSYGFAQAFTDAERDRLALLHLFRDTVDVDAVRLMGDPDTAEEDAVPELAALDRQTWSALLDRAADIGLLSSLGGGYYQIHPALPWYFTSLFTTVYGKSADPIARRAIRAYVRAIGRLGEYYHSQGEAGRAAQVLAALRTEEANLLHALDLACAAGLWRVAVGCLQGLHILYERTGRDSEWARLVAAITPGVTDPVTGGPLPGREQDWSIVTGYRVRLARAARDWPTATALQATRIAWNRDWAAAALAAPPSNLTPSQRNQIRTLGVSLTDLGNILIEQDDSDCLPHYQEALGLDQRIGDRAAEAQDAGTLGNVYLRVSGLENLDQAEHWWRRSLDLRPDSDRLGQALCFGSLGIIALERFDNAQAVGEAEPALLERLNAALHSQQRALELTPADDHEYRGAFENQLGIIFSKAGDTGQALRHYQRSLQHKEARGDIYGAGATRYNIALLLRDAERIGDALQYAHAALDNYRQVGPGAAASAAEVEQLIAALEQHSQQ
jgi:tetratricopeptide (TPR) repeat protein